MATGELAVIILAAGKGTRMKSNKAKVLHLLAGIPLIQYLLYTVRQISPQRILMVIGYQAEEVRAVVNRVPDLDPCSRTKYRHELQSRTTHIEFVYQEEQVGTGHAVLQTYPLLKDFMGEIMVLSGDVPLLTSGSLVQLVHIHRSQKATVSFLTADLDDPKGYGRVIRGKGLEVIRVEEEKDASPQERKIREINSGIYCFQKDFLYEALRLINQDNQQEEYYLTDIVHIAHKRGLRVIGYKSDQPVEILGVNTREELSLMESLLQEAGRKA